MAYQAFPASASGAVFVASGTGHAAGIVPDPGATPGTTHFLREDATWQAIAGGGDALTSGDLSQFAATTSLQLKNLITDETGSQALVFANTPTLVTPILGVATVTSVNKVAITAPATSATLVIADGVTLTCSATVDTNNLAPKVSPTLTTPTLGVATATSINKVTITAPATSSTLTIQDGFTLTVSGSATIASTPLPASGGTMSGAIAMGNNNITAVKQLTFNGVVAGGNKTGAAVSLADWTLGSLQEITLTGNCTGTSTFTLPTGVSRVSLIIHPATFTISAWPTSVKWRGGAAPTLTTNGIDIVTFLYDGTTMYGGIDQAFA